jgi:hypothetical protein
MARVKIESETEVIQWYREGFTFKAMTEEHEHKYGRKPSVAAFQSVIRRRDLPPRALKGTPLIPWDVKPDHQGRWIHTQLRNEARRRAGLPLSESSASELERWKIAMEEADAVVDYRPDSERGYFLTPRRKGVDKDLIREPGA